MVVKFIFAILLIALDRISKILAARFLIGSGSVVIIPGVLGLKYVENTGAAFSILSGKTDFLIVITALALAAIGFYLFKKSFGSKFEDFCFLLIFSGGIGNLIDRIAAGFVIDYFEFLFMEFAVFNVADIYVCVGIGLYAVYTVYTEFLKKDRKSGTVDA